MDRGLSLSAVLASSPSSPLSITVHWCFSPLFLFSSSSLLPWLVLEKELHASTLLDKTDGSSIALASIAGLTGVEPNQYGPVKSLIRVCGPSKPRLMLPQMSFYKNSGVTIYFIPFNSTFPQQFTNIYKCFCSQSSSLFSNNYVPVKKSWKKRVCALLHDTQRFKFSGSVMERWLLKSFLLFLSKFW